MDITQLEQMLGSNSLDMNAIIAMLIFSTIGIIYYRKGKRENDTLMSICGIVLFLYGYFVYQLIYLLIIGIILTIVPQIRRFF